MERKYEVGSPVVYVDPRGVAHDALVTVWWTGNRPIPEYVSATGEPGCNLVFVSDDETRTDQYGRQIDRNTSVVHQSKQPAHGCFWRWPDET